MNKPAHKLIALTARTLVACLLCLLSIAKSDAETITLESATMGPGNRASGLNISSTQMVGWRFRVAKPTQITQVGGHLGGVGGQIFAAIAPLASLDAVPNGALTAESVIGKTTLVPPTSSADVRISFDALLAPGSYALVFGSGLFGATGSGMIPNGQQTNIDPTIRSSYITWLQSLPGTYSWVVGGPNNVRFVVVGEELSSLADFNLDGRVTGADLAVWKGHIGPVAAGGVAAGDADLDGDADGADFLLWQRSIVAPPPTPTTIASTPEPTSLALAALAASAALAGRRLQRHGVRM